MDETIDERSRHDVIAEDVAPFFKPLFDVSTVGACS